MKKKFETANANEYKKEHTKKFASMEEALSYFQTLGKVAVVKTTYEAMVGGMPRGASTQVYPRTWIHLFANGHDFNDVFDGETPEDVIIIQENTPISYPLMRLGLSTLTGDPSKPGCIGR